ncbi:MAG: hypothetical protein WBB28_17730 [Crinalium sp.]
MNSYYIAVSYQLSAISYQRRDSLWRVYTSCAFTTKGFRIDLSRATLAVSIMIHLKFWIDGIACEGF